MLELPNFGQMTTLTLLFELRVEILVMMSWTEIMMS